MCGRYRLAASAELVARIFGLMPEFIEIRIEPGFNIAPTDPAPVVLGPVGERTLRLLRWGYLPPWAKVLREGARMINARSETVASSPAFREPFRHRRCLVPADGWYEWGPAAGASRPGLFGPSPAPEGEKVPWLFRRPDRGLFAFAGLHGAWRGPDGPVHTFTILTRAAAGPVAEVHDRMPVILGPEAADRWTDPAAAPEELLAVLAMEPGPLERVRVSASIGNVRDKGEPSEGGSG